MTAIYNKIGDNYDTTRKADPEITATLAHLLHIQKDKHDLEDFFFTVANNDLKSIYWRLLEMEFRHSRTFVRILNYIKA